MSSLGTVPESLATFSLDDLAQYTREGVFEPDSDPRYRLFFVGRDDVHGILTHLLTRVSLSLKFNAFGYDDDALDALVHRIADNPTIAFQGTLDRSQAGGVHEKKILAGWDMATNQSWAVGQSATHQISHTKGGVADGRVGFEGSTNWSKSGEGVGINLQGLQKPGFQAQNNTLIVTTDPAFCRRFSAQLEVEHLVALQQQASRDKASHA